MKQWLWVMMLVLLSACGFHLKGTSPLDKPIPYRFWQVDGGAVMQRALEDALRQQSNIVLSTTQTDAVIKVLSLNEKKTTSSINLAGNTNEYSLQLNLVSQVCRHGVPLGDPMNIDVQRYMAYADSQILGKQEEEQTIWREMRVEAANQLMHRLPYLPVNP